MQGFEDDDDTPKRRTTRIAETRPQGTYQLRPVAGIKPSSMNELIYGLIDPGRPDMQRLVESIRTVGVRDPIVITKDNVIISGHRRHAACLILGMARVLCRIEPIRSTDPEFASLLVEYNSQRVKTFEETVREHVATMRPGEAYRALIEHRRDASAVWGDSLDLGERKRRSRLGPAKMPLLEAAMAILEAQMGWWPLSVRSVHYSILNAPPLRDAFNPESVYTNNKESYRDLVDVLARARLEGLVPWKAIADPTRPVVIWNVWRNAGDFARKQCDKFLTGYWRDLMMSQSNHIESVGEKNTIEGSIRRVAMRYCIPYTIGRGFSSLEPRHKMFERWKASGKDKLIILILSDYDLSGERIAQSFARSMRDDFDVPEHRLVARKVCLTRKQVEKYKLPVTFQTFKAKKHQEWADKHGARELEALSPEQREKIFQQAIDSVIDTEAFNRELDNEAEDAERIEAMRGAATAYLADHLSSGTP
jgi:hypothetical protein